MLRYRVIPLLILTTVLLSGCVPQFLGKYSLPRKEPVRDAGYPPTLGRLELIASTNCAEVGEAVIFTLRYKNETPNPVTFVSNPPLDIIIEGLRVTTPATLPVQRWSESNQYPANINPVVQPGEEHVYSWQWPADSVYVQDGVAGVMITSEAKLRIGNNQLPQGIGAQVSGLSGTQVVKLLKAFHALACGKE